MSVVIDGTSGITTPAETVNGPVTATGLISGATNYTAFKNRIINGNMAIDQRNAGAVVTLTSTFPVDRFYIVMSAAGKFTAQQNAGAVTPPTGFSNYLGTTSTSAYTAGAAEFFGINHRVEGLNVADLGWGTASASTVTLSFWVRSSLTGTFGGSFYNSGNTRSYPFTYTISSANTWEQKTVTIAGDTSGTWLTTNGVGLGINFSLGAGSTYSGTAGAWAGTAYYSATGATSVVGTNGATFYITGVQLEKGSTATSFDYRPYGTELALCQRYYYRLGSSGSPFVGNAYAATTTQSFCVTTFPIPMRTAPTALEQSGTATNYSVNYTTTSANCSSVPTFSSGTIWSAMTILTTAAVLTAGHGVLPQANSSGYLGWSAEL